MPELSLFTRAIRESNSYCINKPRAVPPADSANRPTLEFLYRYGLWVRSKRPIAKGFRYEGELYRFALLGHRLCVMHARTGRVLVGAPGVRNA